MSGAETPDDVVILGGVLTGTTATTHCAFNPKANAWVPPISTQCDAAAFPGPTLGTSGEASDGTTSWSRTWYLAALVYETNAPRLRVLTLNVAKSGHQITVTQSRVESQPCSKELCGSTNSAGSAYYTLPGLPSSLIDGLGGGDWEQETLRDGSSNTDAGYGAPIVTYTYSYSLACNSPPPPPPPPPPSPPPARPGLEASLRETESIEPDADGSSSLTWLGLGLGLGLGFLDFLVRIRVRVRGRARVRAGVRLG